MAARQATFTEADMKRALKVVRAMGLPVSAVRVERDGTIHIVTAEAEQAKPVDAKQDWHF